MGSELPMTSTSRPLQRHALLLQGLERIAMRCTVPRQRTHGKQVETALDGGITVGDVSPGIDPTTSVCHGEDLHGKLALTLLTPQIADARVLLLTADREAAAVTAAPDPSTCIRVRLDNAGRLPFRTRAFDHVIIDGDMTVPARPFGRKVVEEILRVAQRDATWLVVTRHRRVPRRIRALRDYRLHLNGSAWSDTLSSVGLQPFARTYLRFDGSRLVEMRAASPVHGDSKSRSWGDAEGVLFCRSTPHPSTLQQVLDHVGAHLGARPQLDTILVRKIGKTASLALVGTERILIRIPLSPIAGARAVRNFRYVVGLEELNGDHRLERSRSTSFAFRARWPGSLLRRAAGRGTARAGTTARNVERPGPGVHHRFSRQDATMARCRRAMFCRPFRTPARAHCSHDRRGVDAGH